ncbi:MAG: chemotaxis protein CheW [Gemmataceae bacterium]
MIPDDLNGPGASLPDWLTGEDGVPPMDEAFFLTGLPGFDADASEPAAPAEEPECPPLPEDEDAAPLWVAPSELLAATPAPPAPPAAAAAPEIVLALHLPNAVGTDEEVTGRLVVGNPSAGPLKRFRAALTLPDELVFRGATRGGTLNERGDGVEWPAGEVAGGTEWSAEVRLVGFAPGRLRVVASATADGLAEVTAAAPLACEVRRSAGGSTLAGSLTGPALERYDDGPGRDAPRARDSRLRHLIFRAAGTRFGLPIGSVREVLRPIPITPVPGGPGWLCGVANVRGDIVTVIDLAPFLGLEGAGTRRGIVVIHDPASDPLGLLIDDVAGIHPLAAGTPVPAEGQLARFLAGVTIDPSGLIHRLDPREVLAAAEASASAPV